MSLIASAHAPTDTTAAEPALQAMALWQHAEGAWALVLSGDWRDAAAVCPAPPPGLQGPVRVAFDGAGLHGWDAAPAARLWELQGELRASGASVQTRGLPDGLREVLQLATPTPQAVGATDANAAAPG